jgi:hypothetical protein
MTTVNGQEVTVQQTEDWTPFVPTVSEIQQVERWEPFVPAQGPVKAAKATGQEALEPGQRAEVNITTASVREQVTVEYVSPSGKTFTQTTRSDNNKNVTLQRELNEIGEWTVTIDSESVVEQQTEDWTPFVPTISQVQQTEDWEPTLPTGLETQQTEDWE